MYLFNSIFKFYMPSQRRDFPLQNAIWLQDIRILFFLTSTRKWEYAIIKTKKPPYNYVPK